ncbi:MAG: secondary thiamine-phosphate synthase enzyme YjbQ [Planctomycetia bacterium]|nr:secondary thiamine-phosphate synthase enzyme YjbQ [Planctomycetia bacterium]
MIWLQRELVLPEHSHGIHAITSYVVNALPELRQVSVGLLNVFIRHTSAGLTINENADPDVPQDLTAVSKTLFPEDFPYRHTLEGRDDMPAHLASSIFGSSLTIPVGDGRLQLGVWQGLFLVEARYHGGRRHLVLTLSGRKTVES